MSFKNKSGFFLRSTSVTALAAACCAFSGQALAQDSLETVVVTGTRVGTNIADVAPVGTESIVMDRDKITATGFTNLTDVVRTLPQVQTLDSLGREGGTQNSAGNPTQGSTVNLRGLGSGATLTLVDGRRVAPTGTASNFTESNLLPLAMVERVEVLVDGASAIYGSDAVGGVINYVTRRDMQGVQVSPRYSYNHGYSEWGLALTAGTSWDSLGGLGKGNLIISYDYDQRTSMKTGSQPFLRNDLRSVGGLDNRVSGTSVIPEVGTTYVVAQNGTNYSYYKVASGITGSNVPTMSQLTLQTDPDKMSIIDGADYSDYLGRMHRHQLVATLNQDITPWLSAFYEGFYTNRRTTSHTYQTSPVAYANYNSYTAYDINIGFPYRAVSTSTPWQIAGLIPSTVTPGNTVTQNVTNTYGPVVTSNLNDNFTQTFGFNLKLPAEWSGTGYFIWGLDTSCGYCQFGNNLSPVSINTLTSDGTINPYATFTDTERAMVSGDNLQYARNMINDYVLKFDGPLFDLPGGTVKMAVGGEYSYNTEHLRNGANRAHGEESDWSPVRTKVNEFAWDTVAGLSRSISSAFLELYVPVVGEAMDIPFVKSFNIDAAVRYDYYSDVHGTTNPKVGATWEVVDQLKVRGSWGTSFRAPTLTDKNPYVQSFHMIFPASWGVYTNGTSDHSLDSPTILMKSGNSSSVTPETSENWSLGIDYQPAWLQGFRVSTTYYSIAYANKIEAMSNYASKFISSDENYKTYQPYIHKIAQSSSCKGNDSSTWSDDLRYWVKSVIAVYGSIDANYVCQVNAVFDGRTANIATQRQRGIDFNVDYLLPTDNYGTYDVNLYATTVLDNKVRPVDGADYSERINGIGDPVRWRGRLGLGWFMDPLMANVFVNYIGNGVNDNKLNSSVRTDTPSWITLDFGVTYKFTDELGWKGFDGVRLSLNMQNAFDQNPPITLTSTKSAYDAYRYNAFGRITTLQLVKDF